MKIEFKRGSRRATLLETIVIAGHVIREGFTFNGANIPIWVAPFVWLTRWHPKVRRGACVHDWWWTQAENATPAAMLEPMRKGNEYFRKALIEDDCNRWQVFWVILAVRVSMRWRIWKKARRVKR